LAPSTLVSAAMAQPALRRLHRRQGNRGISPCRNVRKTAGHPQFPGDSKNDSAGDGAELAATGTDDVSPASPRGKNGLQDSLQERAAKPCNSPPRRASKNDPDWADDGDERATKKPQKTAGKPQFSVVSKGGEDGIRTHGTLADTPVFKTGAIDRSATSPKGIRAASPKRRVGFASPPLDLC
jgi:hypothetical protein